MILDVLLPFHREDSYFRECLVSLAKSEFKDFRLILIDDRISMSNQLQAKTLRILKQLRYSYIQTEGSVGYGRALEIGSRLLEAEYVCLFNSDDLMSPNRFTTQINLLQSYDLVYCNMQKFSKRGIKLPFLLGQIRVKYHSIFLLFGSYGANASWMTRLEWWKSNAFFDSDDCLDWRIALCSFGSTQVGKSDEILYFYRKHVSQVTNLREPQNDLEPLFERWREFGHKWELEGLEFATFQTVAAPWARSLSFTKKDFDYLRQFAESISIFCTRNSLSRELLEINRLMVKRYIFAFLVNVRRPFFAARFLLLAIGQIFQILAFRIRAVH
jgi:glycosyltransferase involved in cell wall biosynthesis